MYSCYASPEWDRKFLIDHEDYALWRAMPANLRRELTRYFVALYRRRPGTGREGLPCLWYDIETRRCRNYDWRPLACREFEIGGEDCLRHRNRAGL
jgi:Fe-S-cluster containining protein